MTRETKIGLLVGLAFIIVIGILLSDHMTSSNEPALAPLQVAGANVRSGVGTPASDSASPVVVIPPTNVTPVQPIPTREEMNPPRHAAPIAVIGQQNVQTQNPVPPALGDVARRAGEELVDVDGHPVANTDIVQPPTAPRPPTSYTAVSGDSLTKIATKVYGTSTRANRQAIAEANASLRDNPNRIVAGKTYVIPPLNGAVIPPVSSPTQVATIVDRPVDDAKYSYTVKSGDTLWSIARDQMGDTKTINAIKELNKDVLRGSDRVKPNMKLRLPAKPVTT